jgi:zinc transporter
MVSVLRLKSKMDESSFGPFTRAGQAQAEEETNRNLYILTMFSVILLPATLIASIWGMNVGGIPFSGSPNGFWVVAGLIAVVFALVAIVLFRFRFKLF